MDWGHRGKSGCVHLHIELFTTPPPERQTPVGLMFTSDLIGEDHVIHTGKDCMHPTVWISGAAESRSVAMNGVSDSAVVSTVRSAYVQACRHVGPRQDGWAHDQSSLR